MSTFRASLFAGIALVLSIIRLASSDLGRWQGSFEAFAHLFVGGFIGAAIMGYYHRIGGWKFYAWLAGVFTVVEIVAFLMASPSR